MKIEKDPIFVIAPMECEHSTIYNALENKTDLTIGNYSFTKGYIDDYPIVLAKSMIGMVNVSAVTTIGIERFHPKAIIIEGTAGAHNPTLHKGDIVLGENIIELSSYYTHHKDEGEGYGDVHNRKYPGEEMIVNGEKTRITELHSTESLLNIAFNTPFNGKLIKGTISSGDLWNKEIDFLKYSYEERHSDCEEMEGFAVGQIAHQYGIDFLCIRIISNSEYYEEEIFDKEIATICQTFTIHVIKRIIKTY